tara:strand:- start:680 stop:1249 length:570 start_codon:yes stop_codon:yes gene_type:complete
MNKGFLQEQQERLAEQFEQLRLMATSDTERGEIIKDFVLQSERMRHNCFEPGAERDEIDRRTLEKLADPLELGPEFSRDEAIFRRLTTYPATASRYWDQSHKQLSTAQSEKASKPRKGSKDKITLEIERILLGDPRQSAKQVGRALEAHDKITFKNDEYSHADDQSTLKFINLPSRVSDAKERLNKKSG